MGCLCIKNTGLDLRKANQEKLEAEEQAENERIEQYARDKREREAGESGTVVVVGYLLGQMHVFLLPRSGSKRNGKSKKRRNVEP